VDGREAFFGGFNVADMYCGRHPRLSPWRDTHVRLKGPGTRDLAESFAEDWTAAGGEVPPGIGEFKPAPAGEAVCAVFPTGPSRRGNRATLLVLGLIQGARERLWISTPYLVPNEAVFIALQAAVLRGVEVVILTAAQRDHYASHLAGYYYARELRSVGVTVMRYREGFLHQKAILVDDRWAAIGSMNLDNRSLQLNFEMTVLFVDAATVRSVEAMLRADLARSDESQGEWTGLGQTRQLLCCAARLFAPLL
ncbi:MAG: phospholipase D-like domain-containing protein, partial [Opitutales bacterium]